MLFRHYKPNRTLFTILSGFFIKLSEILIKKIQKNHVIVLQLPFDNYLKNNK